MSAKAFFIGCCGLLLLVTGILVWSSVRNSVTPLADIFGLIWDVQKPPTNDQDVATVPAASPAEVPAAQTDNGIAGSYYVSKPGMTPQFGVKFLDDTEVDMYTDGAKNGGTCHYVVNGDQIVITHACGVWHLDKRGDDLFNEELNWSFSKQ